MFVCTGQDFVVSAIGLRKDIYERVARMRTRPKRRRHPDHRSSGSGGRAVGGRRRAPERGGVRPARRENPLSPSATASWVGSRAWTTNSSCSFVRCPRFDVGEALSTRVADADLAVLLADLWERPGHHVESFTAGGAPSYADLVLEEEELAARSSVPDSETELVTAQTEGQIRRLLDGTIEEWMVYLHPSQRAIVRAQFNGPSRVRGGPAPARRSSLCIAPDVSPARRPKANGCCSPLSCGRSRRSGMD